MDLTSESGLPSYAQVLFYSKLQHEKVEKKVKGPKGKITIKTEQKETDTPLLLGAYLFYFVVSIYWHCMIRKYVELTKRQSDDFN